MFVQIETTRDRADVEQRLSQFAEHLTDRERAIGSVTISMKPLNDGQFKISIASMRGEFPIAWKVRVVGNLIGAGSRISLEPKRGALWVGLSTLWTAFLLMPMVWGGSGSLRDHVPGIFGALIVSGYLALQAEGQRYREGAQLTELLESWLE